MDIVASRVIKPERGNVIEALQELISEMRNDIQPWSFCRFDPPEIKHIYTKVKNNNQSSTPVNNS